MRRDTNIGALHATHLTLVAVPVLAVEALRNRRSYVALLPEPVELAECTREEEARRRVEQARLRIARDLHDVGAHTLTTTNVHAGVAAHLLDRNADRPRVRSRRSKQLATKRSMSYVRSSASCENPTVPAPRWSLLRASTA